MCNSTVKELEYWIISSHITLEKQTILDICTKKFFIVFSCTPSAFIFLQSLLSQIYLPPHCQNNWHWTALIRSVHCLKSFGGCNLPKWREFNLLLRQRMIPPPRFWNFFRATILTTVLPTLYSPLTTSSCPPFHISLSHSCAWLYITHHLPSSSFLLWLVKSCCPSMSSPNINSSVMSSQLWG